jgi:di/tricarboxylate transporter
MTLAQVIVIIALAIPLALAFFEKIRIEVAALLIAALLGLAQFAGLSILAPANTPSAAPLAFSGFGQPVIITLMGLFILTESLDRAGVTGWIAVRVLRLGGNSERRVIGLFAFTAALLSLLMNNVAVGALLLPSALDVARQKNIAPSKLLIPISFGTLLGGGATYFTTANIIASEMLTRAQPPQAPLQLLDFLPTGGLIALAGLLYIVICGPALLPNRTPEPYPVAAMFVSSSPVRFTRRKVRQTLVICGGAILAAILGMPTSLAVMCGALLIFLFGIMPFAEALQVIEWRAIFPVAALYSVGLAMQQTGLAVSVGNSLIALGAPLGSIGLVILAFLITALLTQFIGGQIAANVTAPIVISAALSAGSDPRALALVTAIGCSAAFLTPIAHPVNLLMVDVAGYHTRDFARIGAGLFGVCLVTLVVVLPLFWRI